MLSNIQVTLSGGSISASNTSRQKEKGDVLDLQ